MRYITGAMHAGFPLASPTFVIKLECWAECDVCTPYAKLTFSFGRVLWRRRLRCSAIFGAPGLPIRARSLMHSNLSASPPPHFGSYLPGWVPTLITGMITCGRAYLGPVLVPIAQPHQRARACRSTMGACMRPRVQARQCRLYVVFAICIDNT